MSRPPVKILNKQEFLDLQAAVSLLIADGLSEDQANDLTYDLYQLHKQHGGRNVLEGVKHYLELRHVVTRRP